MEDFSRLNKFFDYWEKVLDESEREMLMELASELSVMRDKFNSQSDAIKEHIIKLQLYGYESTAIQTIYDIQNNLLQYTTRPEKKYLKNFEKVINLYQPFNDSSYYLSYAREVFRTKIKKKYFVKPNWNNLDFDKTDKVLDYLADLIVKKTIPNREIFYSEIRKILGI